MAFAACLFVRGLRVRGQARFGVGKERFGQEPTLKH